MGELMTKHMWNERSKEVVADTKNMVLQVVERYKSAYSYCILQQIRKDLSGKNEQALLLEQRKWQNYNRPLQSGSLYVLCSSDHRKWRRRYCVLQPDYTLEVYDTEEDFDVANRPRYTRKFSSFKVVDNLDAHFSQLVKDYLRDFGYVRENVSEVIKKVCSVSEPSKRPTQHVLALYHKYRGTFYMAADSAVEKEKWLKSMQDAERQLSGVHCENYMQKEAFEFAIRQSCDAEEHCGISVTMSGTQEEITADFITDYLSNGCKTMLQTKVKGDVVKKFKMWDAISKRLAGSVENVVKIDYPPLRRKAELEAEELKSRMISSMPQINTVFETAYSEIIAGLDPNFRDDLEVKILPKIPELVTRMGDLMSISLREIRDIFISLAESVQRQTINSSEFANHIDRFFLDHLDVAPRNPEIMTNAFQAAIGKKSQFSVLSETFPKVEYSEHEVNLCLLLQRLLDSAICTLEMLCGESVVKNDGKLQATSIAKIERRVLKKLNHDNIVLTKRFLSEVTSRITFKMLRHVIYHDSRSKLRNYEDFIPSELTVFMPIANVFKDIVIEHINEQIQLPLSAAFKRLATDHFNMTSYHSSSTINSHSSNASEELHSLVRRELSSSSASSPPPSPTKKSTPVAVALPTLSTEENGMEKGKVEDVVLQETQNESENTQDPCEGVPMDGETGEYAVDEYGEPIIKTKKDSPFETNEDSKPSEVTSQGLLKKNDELLLEDSEVKLEEDVPQNHEVEEISNMEEEITDRKKNSLKENGSENFDPETGGTVLLEQDVGKEVFDPETGGSLNSEVSREAVCDDVENTFDSNNDSCSNETKIHMREPYEYDAGTGGKEHIKDSTVNIFDKNESVGEPLVDSISENPQKPEVEEKQNQGDCEGEFDEASHPIPHDKDVVQKSNRDSLVSLESIDSTHDGGVKYDVVEGNPLPSIEQDEPTQYSCMMEENGESTHNGEVESGEHENNEKEDSIHQNGGVKLNGHSELSPDEQDVSPPVPARKKKHAVNIADKTKSQLITNDEHGDEKIGLVQPQSCGVGDDLEKYNGVVEQIIHTGEEKLI